MTESSLSAEVVFGRLTLVGVVHLDPGGETRLSRLLAGWRPDLITLQISPYAVRWRRRNSRQLQEILSGNLARAADRLGLGRKQAAAHGAIRAVAAQLQVPFEFRAAREYQRRFGGRIRLVEDSQVSRRLLDVLGGEVLSVDNLAGLLGSSDVSLAARCRGQWQRAAWGTDQEDAIVLTEEAALAAAVARAHLWFNPRTHVHVCGFTHLGPLGRRLRHLGPMALRLDEEDPSPARSGRGSTLVPGG
jgi:hypothetical protein